MFDYLIQQMGPGGTSFALVAMLVALVGAHALARRLPNHVR